MIRAILVAAAMTVGVTAVLAQEDPVEQRQKIYKSWGAAAKEPGQMLKGETKFDLDKVQAALRTFTEGTKHLPKLFPANAKSGAKTAALPAIWEKQQEFNALFVKFENEAQAALNTIKDEATFKAEFPKVLRNCGGCHETFRAKT